MTPLFKINFLLGQLKRVSKLAQLTMLLLLINAATDACDMCGCGVGNYYFGIMPQMHKNFAGIRYRHQMFTSHVGLSAALQTQEEFQSAELYARIYITKKIQVLTIVPYHYNKQSDNLTTQTVRGIGDIPVLLNCMLINTADHPLRKVNHLVWIGGGVKAPTGEHSYTDDGSVGANANFQTGSGSWDVMVNTQYTLRFAKWGINTDVSAKLNTANAEQYRFGNRVSVTSSFFYIQQLKQVGFMVYAGCYGEYSGKSKEQTNAIAETGGSALFTNTGIDVFYKGITMGVNHQVPLTQHLGEGRIVADNRGMLHLTFLF